MKNTVKLLLLGALICSLNLSGMVKPGTPDVNGESASLERDVDQFNKKDLSPAAQEARAAATKQLSQRYLQLGLKSNKTAAEEKEFQEIAAELKTRLGNAFSSLFNK